MKTYEIAVSVSQIQTYRLRAETVQEAKRMACDEAGVVESAVSWWRVVPTAKQIKKTKSLLRGL